MAEKSGITAAREVRGWSTKDLARMIGFPEATVRRLENPMTVSRLVAKEVVDAVVAAFEMSANQLFTAEQLGRQSPQSSATGNRHAPRGRGSRREPVQGEICKSCYTEIPLIHGKTCPDCS